MSSQINKKNDVKNQYSEFKSQHLKGVILDDTMRESEEKYYKKIKNLNEENNILKNIIKKKEEQLKDYDYEMCIALAAIGKLAQEVRFYFCMSVFALFLLLVITIIL